ncbi:MAG: heme o synthase [Saprospiraceae bacterium]
MRLLKDLGNLIKFKVNLVVVFTSILGYLVASGGRNIDLYQLLGITLGGFFTTGAAHAINQIIERKHDLKMERTNNRPLPSGSMSVMEVAIYAAIMVLLGYLSFSLFNNELTLILGMGSLLVYSFLYTPMKRVSPIAVAIGAIPGALPPTIGYVAFTGRIDGLAIVLFLIQFFWQFPHFWSIAWLYFDDYNRAGYQLFPTDSGKSVKNAFYTFISSLTLIPFVFLLFTLSKMNIYAIGLVSVLTLGFILYAYVFYKKLII